MKMAARPIRVLGIETSCDETAAAVVSCIQGSRPMIESNVVLSQAASHEQFGGVVPEIAARAHVDALDDVVAAALSGAQVGFGDLDAVAATAGPGLVGGLLVGMMTAKAIAAVHGLPFVAVNHLAGHALSVRLTDDVAYPYLLLLVSGGHCQLLGVAGPTTFRRYGTTIDDAAGEAFDKTAKAMGLGYPGGPALEALAKGGDPSSISLPRPLLGRPGADFSFAGLKTAVLQTLKGFGPEASLTQKADLAASFQAAVADSLADRTANAAALFRADFPGTATPVLAVAGGVAANQQIRLRLRDVAEQFGMRFVAPPLALCTDNAAMIAYAGLEAFAAGVRDGLDAPVRVRWPLDKAQAGLGVPHKAGKKGPKA